MFVKYKFISLSNNMKNLCFIIFTRTENLRERFQIDGNKSPKQERYGKSQRYESNRQSVRDCLSITERPMVVFTIYRKFVTRRRLSRKERKQQRRIESSASVQ